MAIVLLFAVGAHSVWATSEAGRDTLRVRHASSAVIDVDEDYYFYRLLLLAVAKTQHDWGRLEVQELPYMLQDKRLRTALSQGVVDVIWSPTSHEYEERMLPVRVSLLKDLNNYRLLLIRKGDQPRFSSIKGLRDLSKLRGGISPQWTDAKIMEHNKLTLVEAVGYQKLFKMLAANRFDYFSRGVYQINAEMKVYGHLGLIVEKELILSYPNEVYFFVRKNDYKLAERIEVGLTRALEDGSFDELLMSVPSYKWGTELLKTQQRRLIVLESLPQDKND